MLPTPAGIRLVGVTVSNFADVAGEDAMTLPLAAA